MRGICYFFDWTHCFLILTEKVIEVFGGDQIKVKKEQQGTVFEVTIDRDDQRFTGTMQIVDPKKLQLKFDLKSQKGGQDITIEMTEIDGKLRINGPICGSESVGILRSFSRSS